MNRKFSTVLLALVIAACGRDGEMTGPTTPLASPTTPGVLALGTDPVSGASIETNKDDYSPGEVVHLVGRGWAAGETVNLHMTESPNTHADVDTNVVADASGGFSIHFYDVQQHDLGVTFTLTATGQTSQSVAVATFTDGNVSLASSPVSVSLSYAITSNSNTCTATVFTTGTSVNFSASGHSYPECTEVRAPTTVVVASVTYTFSSWLVEELKAGSVGITHSAGVDGTSQWLKFVAPGQNTTGAITAQYSAPPSNTPPVLTGVPTTTQSIPELVLYTFDADASDSDLPSQTLTFSIVGSLPAGATFNTSTGVFEWTPTEAQGPSGPHSFTVRVSDGIANTDQAVTLNVTEVNVAPELNSIGDQSVDEGSALTFTANASDSDLPLNTLTYSLVGAPATASINPTSGAFSWTPTDGPSQTATFTVRVTDNGVPALSDDEIITVTVDNVKPTVTAVTAPGSVNEGTSITFSATSVTDPSTIDFAAGFEFDYSCDGGSTWTGFSTTTTGSCAANDGPSTITVAVRAKDKDGGISDPTTKAVSVLNVVPTITSITGPLSPVPVSTSASVTINFTDPAGTYDAPYTAMINWDDGLGYVSAGTVTSGGSVSKTFTSAGIYTVCATVTDKDGGTSVENCFEYIVVYDASAGFVTGGGWINSLPGFYRSNPSATGKANFGFVSKYQPGKTVPTGNTEFQFHAGSLNFQSTIYEWLVVAGAKAIYKGEGTIAGQTGTYKFLLSAIDGSPDKFRIKIWEKSIAGTVIYDTLIDAAADDADPTTMLGGGSIVIHTKK